MKKRRSSPRSSKVKIRLFLGLIVLLVPFLWPERARIPVEGATARDWNKTSFWYEPRGDSGVHKSIDIFAPAGRPVGGLALLLIAARASAAAPQLLTPPSPSPAPLQGTWYEESPGYIATISSSSRSRNERAS